MTQESITVTKNDTAQRYEAVVDGRRSILQYEQAGDRIVYVHTEVPVALRGRGIASALVRTALDDARVHHQTVVPACPFVSAFIRRHPAYRPLVAPSTVRG